MKNTTFEVNNCVIWKDRATSIWIVRNRSTHQEVAHESNMKDAITAANMKHESGCMNKHGTVIK